MSNNKYIIVYKVILDFLFSVFVIILTLPILLIMMVILAIVNNGFPFFTQTRSGKNGKIFKVIKFKTMNDKRDNDGNIKSDIERLTKLGEFI